MPADLWTNLTTVPPEWAFTVGLLALVVLGLVVIFRLADRGASWIIPDRLQQPPLRLDWVPGCNCHDCLTARGRLPTVPALLSTPAAKGFRGRVSKGGSR